jgi:hypothetical protein
MSISWLAKCFLFDPSIGHEAYSTSLHNINRFIKLYITQNGVIIIRTNVSINYY